jgi:hypothetical protein
MTDTERAFLEQISKIPQHRLAHPLSAALLFSPLYLLTDKKLTSNAWQQKDMVLVRGLYSPSHNTHPFSSLAVESSRKRQTRPHRPPRAQAMEGFAGSGDGGKHPVPRHAKLHGGHRLE